MVNPSMLNLSTDRDAESCVGTPEVTEMPEEVASSVGADTKAAVTLTGVGKLPDVTVT